MKLRNLFTLLLLAVASLVTAQAVVRPSQIGRFDEVQSQKLNLRGGVFTGKVLQLNAASAKSYLIPSAEAVYNATLVTREQVTIVTDTVDATVTIGNTAFKYGATQAAVTITLPASPTSGDVVFLEFEDVITALTISGGSVTVRGTAATSTAVGTVLSYIYIGGAVNKWYRRL